MEDDVDFIVGTFSKSLGAVGGFLVSERRRTSTCCAFVSRPYMFTASLPPAVIASTLTALERAGRGQGPAHRLAANADRLYDGLRDMGYVVGPHTQPDHRRR